VENVKFTSRNECVCSYSSGGVTMNKEEIIEELKELEKRLIADNTEHTNKMEKNYNKVLKLRKDLEKNE